MSSSQGNPSGGALGMEELIPVINRLQNVFSTVSVRYQMDLPQIVVVGSQSSGKSSVLENVVGADFLPRGSGIVTRRPLVLQLVQAKPGTKPYGMFLHQKNKKFYDFNDIRKEIEVETDRITGKNKGISPQPIGLTIISPHVLDLTLVDLPGMTKNPVGDQPPDIERHIRDMIMKYISKKNSIILAVTPANSDLANSDALNLAREVDPEGNRTVGLITKLDIMDKGTDAMDVLTGKVIPLKLSYIGVVNRSQSDINDNKTITSALQSEAMFFRNHPVYRTVAHRAGTPFLMKRMNQILIEHIQRTLPEVKEKIKVMTQETAQQLAELGKSPAGNNKAEQGALLLELLTKFSNDFRNAIDGQAPDLTTSELFGGARINYIFNEIFADGLTNIDPCDGLTTEDIRTAIRNATGPKSALFVPEVAFEILIRRQISRLEAPSLRCIDLVYEELVRIVAQVDRKEDRFPLVRERVSDIANSYLSHCLVPTNEMVSNLIKIELAFINTAHPDFIGGTQAVAEVMERIAEMKGFEAQREMQQQQQAPRDKGKGGGKPEAPAPPSRPSGGAPQSNFFNYLFGGKDRPRRAQPRERGDGIVTLAKMPHTLRPEGELSDRERVQTELIKILLRSYFAIISKQVTDSIPKSIMWGLVNRAKQNIQRVLVTQLYKEDMFNELLREGDALSQQRQQTAELLSALREANEIVKEISHFHIS